MVTRIKVHVNKIHYLFKIDFLLILFNTYLQFRTNQLKNK